MERNTVPGVIAPTDRQGGLGFRKFFQGDSEWTPYSYIWIMLFIEPLKLSLREIKLLTQDQKIVEHYHWNAETGDLELTWKSFFWNKRVKNWDFLLSIELYNKNYQNVLQEKGK